MSAVIRMKRRISDEPHGAFVLNCKKQKIDGHGSKLLTSAPGETSTVLKFAGTVNQGADISEHLAKLTRNEAKDIVNRKRPESSGLKGRLEQNREKSQQNRFKIVNYTRALSQTAEQSSSPSDKNLTIVDVEKDLTSTKPAEAAVDQAQSSSFSDISDEPYVYDIYIADDAESVVQYPDSVDLNDLSILEYNDYLYSRPRLVNSESEDDDAIEDEDSNDENNYRNDYPDEDDDSDNESIGEPQLRRAMNNFDIDNDLSTDEDEQHNGFVYSVDSEAIGFEDDLDYCDVNRYGEAYAKYKKRIISDLNDGSDDSSGSEEYFSGKDESFHSD